MNCFNEEFIFHPLISQISEAVRGFDFSTFLFFPFDLGKIPNLKQNTVCYMLCHKNTIYQKLFMFFGLEMAPVLMKKDKIEHKTEILKSF